MYYKLFNNNYILKIQIEKMDEERGSWCACGHTKENCYAVRGLVSGHSYRFRICAVNKIGDSDFLTSDPLTVTEAEDSQVRYRTQT